MKHKHVDHKHITHNDGQKTSKPKKFTIAYWTMGISSIIWLLLRSGTKPKRLSYPCQRAAAANSVGFLAYLASLVGSATLLKRVKTTFSPSRLLLFTFAMLLTVSLQSSVMSPAMLTLAESPSLPGWTSPTAISDVFVITNVPVPQYSLNGGTIPDGVTADEALHDDGVDALVNQLEAHGEYFYKTDEHPTGLFGAEDIIVIKVNNQWGGKNSTNTDVVKGLIYRLVERSDQPFTGAVIIAENHQGRNSDWDDDGSYGYNATDPDQSYKDIADAFASQGYHVCTESWGNVDRYTPTNIVQDYDAGDNNEGYVLMAGVPSEDPSNRRLSYPKFQVNCNGLNLKISMYQGIWNEGTASFDNEHLKMINLPVLKYHSATGATIALKNYLGFLTVCSGNGSEGSCSNGEARWISPSYKHCWLLSTEDADGGTCTTETQEYGLVARQMTQVRRADLDIVDAIWVNPYNNAGYRSRARRQDVLLASRDPLAVDYYAADYILAPLVEAYESEHDHTESMASHHGSLFRSFLMNNAQRLHAAGSTDVINIDDDLTFNEERNQFNVYVNDASDTPTQASISLLAPNGGENWEVGTDQNIEWTSTNLAGNVRLEYSIDGFTTPVVIVEDTENDGTHSWNIPDDPSDNARVRISSILTPTISDVSQSVFAIVPPPEPSLHLLAPNGSEVWEAGQDYDIQWTSSNMDGNVHLEYSTDGFVTPKLIADDITDDGTYTWTVPNDPSETVRVRITSIQTLAISDTSDAVFTIIPPPQPTVTLISPNGGEIWEIGSEHEITWSSINMYDDIRLDYSTDAFATTTTIVGSTPNDGAYNWTIPDRPSEGVAIRISSALSTTISDTTESTFSIVGPYNFEDSRKMVSDSRLEGGEVITYTITLYEAISATLTLTDSLPAPSVYIEGSTSINPQEFGTVFINDNTLRWSGIVTGSQPVTLTFAAQIPDTTMTLGLVNRAYVSRNGADLIELDAISLLNAKVLFLPLIIRE